MTGGDLWFLLRYAMFSFWLHLLHLFLSFKPSLCRSSDLESEQCEPTENSFVMKDVVLDSSAISSEKEQNNKNISQPLYENQEIRRTSVGRPMRKAAEKVSSYKETPLNIKMRRED